jgi:hypothetical protein
VFLKPLRLTDAHLEQRGRRGVRAASAEALIPFFNARPGHNKVLKVCLGTGGLHKSTPQSTLRQPTGALINLGTFMEADVRCCL